MLQPPNPGSFVCFSLICSRRGGATAAVRTLDTAVDERRKKVADRVVRSPARLCRRDGEASLLSTPSVRFSCFFAGFPVSFSPPLSRYVSPFRVASSVVQQSSTLQQLRVLVPSVFRLISGFPFFFFRFFFSNSSSCVYLVGVFVVLSYSYPVRRHLISLLWSIRD